MLGWISISILLVILALIIYMGFLFKKNNSIVYVKLRASYISQCKGMIKQYGITKEELFDE